MIWGKLHFWGQNMDLLYLNAIYMPFVSKLVKTNLISLAAKAILDKPLPKIPENKWQKINNYGIKVPQFSFMQLEGADIRLGVEMQSTGEAACFGNS